MREQPSRFQHRIPRRRVAPLLVALSLLAVVAACRRGGGASTPPAPPPATPMPPPTPLYRDNGGGIRDSVRVIAFDAATLNNYWRQATSTQASPPPIPAIDFNRDMVIIVAAGRQTPEEQIHVDSLSVRRELMPSGRQEEVLTIVVRTVVGCGRLRTEAYPVEIVRARRFTGPVKWSDKTERSACLEWPLPGT